MCSKISFFINTPAHKIFIIFLFIFQINACTETTDTNKITVNIGSDRQIVIGDSVEIDALIDSADNEPSLTINWKYLSTPSASNLVDITTTEQSIALLPDVVGIYVLRVTVSNNEEFISEDDVSITVISLQELKDKILEVTHDTVLETDENGKIVTIAFRLKEAPTSPVTFQFISNDATEGTVTPSSLIFLESNWQIFQELSVKGLDDNSEDGSIAYSIVTSAIESDDADYARISVADISVTNLDNDVAGLTLSENNALITSEAGGTNQFTLALSSRPTAPVDILLVSSDTSEGDISPNSVTFTDTSWNFPQTIILSGIDDNVVDGDTDYIITISVGNSVDEQYAALTPIQLAVTNIDNEQSNFGLTTRPDNQTCLAPEKPVTNTSISLERAFSDLTFNKPVKILQAPNDANRWYVVEQNGKVKTFLATDTTTTDFIALPNDVLNNSGNEAGLLGMAFHPQYGQPNYKAYLSYNGYTDGKLDSRIAEFSSSDNGATLLLNSEKTILQLTQPYNNHNGGEIAFGPDGYLYIGFGDGGSGGDPDEHGQNKQTLLGAMLRIDINDSFPYSIPADNPFAENADCSAGACPEIYAWGLRNPWRFSFDSATGDLWLGDVGQYRAEEVNKIQLGGNYGWNYREGFDCFNGEPCGDGSMIDPIVVYATGSEGNAITGGFVYHGNDIPSLKGTYLYADYGRGKIWGLFYDNNGAAAPELLIDSSYYISSFGQSSTGELYITDLGGGRIFKITSEIAASSTGFPQKLSETGCMDTADITKPGTALIPYDVNLPLWTDGAIKQRWLALPNGTTITIADDGNNWVFPIGTVFVKHFNIGNTLVETRTLIRHADGNWAGYSYEWDEDGLDATLLQGGKLKNVAGVDWAYPSGAQCMECHTLVSGFSIGPETLQLNKNYTYPNGVTDNQLIAMNNIGLFSDSIQTDADSMYRLPQIDAPDKAVDARARAYLHANCAFCHQENGTGRGPANFHYLSSASTMGVCDVTPETGDLGVSNAKLLTPANPDSSVISLRMKALDVNRMPPIGTGIEHAQGTSLIDDWITNMISCATP